MRNLIDRIKGSCLKRPDGRHLHLNCDHRPGEVREMPSGRGKRGGSEQAPSSRSAMGVEEGSLVGCVLCRYADIGTTSALVLGKNPGGSRRRTSQVLVSCSASTRVFSNPGCTSCRGTTWHRGSPGTLTVHGLQVLQEPPEQSPGGCPRTGRNKQSSAKPPPASPECDDSCGVSRYCTLCPTSAKCVK